MKSKVKRGSSKFRNEHASKMPKLKSMHMTGQVSGYPRGNRSAKKRSK